MPPRRRDWPGEISEIGVGIAIEIGDRAIGRDHWGTENRNDVPANQRLGVGVGVLFERDPVFVDEAVERLHFDQDSGSTRRGLEANSPLKKSYPVAQV